MSASQQSWRFEQKLEAAWRRRRCIGRQRNELALRAILRTKVSILDEAVAQPPGFRQQLAHGQFLDLLDVLLFSSDEQTGAREPKSPLSTRIPSVHQGLSAKMANLVHLQPMAGSDLGRVQADTRRAVDRHVSIIFFYASFRFLRSSRVKLAASGVRSLRNRVKPPKERINASQASGLSIPSEFCLTSRQIFGYYS